MLIADLISKDAAYLSACIERYRGTEDKNVRIPLECAEFLLRNYMRFLGMVSQPAEAAVNPIVAELQKDNASVNLMANQMAQYNEFLAKMKIQQEEIVAALTQGRPLPPLPTVPQPAGATT